MGSPAFGVMPGNNAPPPMFGNQTNPTGGAGLSFGGSNFNFPMFGSTTPTSNLGIFNSGNMGNLSSGFDLGSNWQSFDNMLGKAYGKGTGQALYNIFDQGLFNPTVAASFLNAMQPGVNQGEQSIMNQFGAEGSRFGSAASLGLGNYMSQVNLNEQATLAQMYQQAQSEQLNLLENVLPTIHQERSDVNPWFNAFAGVSGLNLMEGAGGTNPASFGSNALSAVQNWQGGNSSTPNNPNAGSNFMSGMNVSNLDAITADASAGSALGGATASAGSTFDFSSLAGLL